MKNTDAKALWTIFAFRVSPTLLAWSSPVQRGFIKGRATLLGPVSVDSSARAIAFASQPSSPGAAISWDFKAAFPSICRQFILDVLAAAEFPTEFILIAAATWKDTRVVNSEGEGQHRA